MTTVSKVTSSRPVLFCHHKKQSRRGTADRTQGSDTVIGRSVFRIFWMASPSTQTGDSRKRSNYDAQPRL